MYDREIWFRKYVDKAIKAIGIKSGQVVLDFGAGEGSYTLPIAKAVGKDGEVYAYEKDPYPLKALEKEKNRLKFTNIKIIKSTGRLPLPFLNKFFDVVIVYDVLHSYYFTDKERIEILREFHRILKDEGFLSSFPKHMIEKEFIEEAKRVGFCLFKRIPLKLLHYGFLEDGMVLNFKKCTI